MRNKLLNAFLILFALYLAGQVVRVQIARRAEARMEAGFYEEDGR